MLIKVLIADDVAELRKLEKDVLENEPEIEVVGEASDAPEAVRLARALKPDVIVMDLHMPGNGFTATQVVKALRPQVRVLAVTVDPERYGPGALGRMGADALLSKTEIASELIPTITRLARAAA